MTSYEKPINDEDEKNKEYLIEIQKKIKELVDMFLADPKSDFPKKRIDLYIPIEIAELSSRNFLYKLGYSSLKDLVDQKKLTEQQLESVYKGVIRRQIEEGMKFCDNPDEMYDFLQQKCHGLEEEQQAVERWGLMPLELQKITLEILNDMIKRQIDHHTAELNRLNKANLKLSNFKPQ